MCGNTCGDGVVCVTAGQVSVHAVCVALNECVACHGCVGMPWVCGHAMGVWPCHGCVAMPWVCGYAKGVWACHELVGSWWFPDWRVGLDLIHCIGSGSRKFTALDLVLTDSHMPTLTSSCPNTHVHTDLPTQHITRVKHTHDLHASDTTHARTRASARTHTDAQTGTDMLSPPPPPPHTHTWPL